MTSDQWFEFWMRLLQVGGSGLLTLVGAWLGFKIARRADVGDQQMSQVASWNRRLYAAIDELRSETREVSLAPAFAASQRAMRVINDAIIDDPPATNSRRRVPSPAQLMVYEILALLATYEDSPSSSLTRLQALAVEYQTWTLAGRGPKRSERMRRKEAASVPNLRERIEQKMGVWPT